MAETTYKTKEKNIFRFKSFADRVNEIDLRRLALYHIGHQNEQLAEDEHETHFHQTLKKWMVLNLTEEFNVFSRKCQRIVTLPQLIHQKDVVIDALLDRLATATNLSLQPLLELLFVLARDLREEFYPYFQRVLDRLICLLNTQDAEQLEWTFVCLAYLFKALKPYLKRNIGVVFHTILPLLDEQRYDEPVTNFAVECFSFIARDVRDYKKFLDFVLETVAREQTQSVHGCGRLLFEIMRGVKGQFHSAAGDFLHFIFNALIDEKCKNEEKLLLLGEIVETALQETLKFVYPQNMNVFWQKLCDVAGKIENDKRIIYITPVFIKATSYRGGKHLAEMDVVVPTVLKMIDKCMRNGIHEPLQHLSLIVSKIVLAVSTQVTQLDISRLIKKMLNVEDRKIYDEFVLSTVMHPQFELLILPAVVGYYENHFDLQALELMASIVLEKQPLAVNGVQMAHWKEYPIHLKKPQTVNKIVEKFSKMKYNRNEETVMLEEYLLLCIIAPHLKALDGKAIESDLKRITCDVLESLEQLNVEKPQNKLQILCLLIETSVHLGHEFSKDFLRKCLTVQLRFVNNYFALSCIDQLLTRNIKYFTEQKQQICEAIAPLLSSPQHDLRLIAAHCLKTLHQSEASKSPYEAIFAAELIEPDLHNYREQLLHLQKLETTSELFKSFANERYKVDVLRFLLGMLYQNFKLVWEPSLKLIEEYANTLNVQTFWSIYKTQLESTVLNIKSSYEEQEKATESDIELHAWSAAALKLALPQLQAANLNQHELFNYRNLLWQRLPKFGQLVEVKNRELVAMFFDFIDGEYKKVLEKREYTWDLLAMTGEKDKQNLVNELEIESEESDDEEDIENLTEKSETKTKVRRKQKSKPNSVVKALLQTLQIKLGIFPVQPNPKALYREAELYALYMELLAGSNPNLQKLALDCLLAYKKKSLTGIKEHLYAMIDEQKFKEELIQFKLDVIPVEQRSEVMEILLRLLYGKMLTKGTHRSMTAQVRKSLILRFLGQCDINEIFLFLQMAFGRFEQYTTAAIEMEDIPQLVEKEFNVKAVCSPRKLKAIVNLLEIVRKEFGGIMHIEFHVYMLKLLIFVGSTCQAVLDATTMEKYQNQMHPKMPLVFRNTKNAALLSLVNFFMHLDAFEWQQSQLNCIIDVFVWSNIARLPQECIHTPTPLLKLLLQWGEQPRFYECLNRLDSTGQRTIFHFMIELLLNERAKQPIRKPLMTVVENLLVAASNNEDVQSSSIALAVVKPFIPDILQRLRMNLGGQQQRKRQRQVKVSKQDINILSLLTTHVEDATTCDSLLQLLLPILISRTQQSANEEVVVCQVITTLSNLIKRLDEPEAYLQKIAPLFEFIQDVGARKMLCALVVDIASKRLKEAKKGVNTSEGLCERLKDAARLVLMLNAWDKRWVEQPDYDKRLDALKEVASKLENGQIDLDLGVLVIYNCCYFLRYDKDMGLRDNAGEHLRLLMPKLTKFYAEDTQTVNYLVNDIFINLVRRLIRDPKDNIRNEGIHLLGAMVRECPEAHAIFSDLHPLGDKNDEEVDFFENLTHLQSHRHGRALQKFCNHAGTLTTTPATRTLTEFLLPLATRYLLQEKYASKHTLVDAAIETVGVVCQLLPWQHYHTILRYYLNKMRHSHDYQKQCVRIVVRILDAFHFDLSQSRDSKADVKVVAKEKVQPTEETEEIGEEAEDDLDAALEVASTEEDTIVEKSSKLSIETVLLMKHLTPLSANASKRILTTITCNLIPTLNRTITEKSHYDTKHKVNRKRVGFEREEEEILRVPIALALVKLLQKLPKELLDNSLPGVFMKVCTFLRSPLKSVRMLTRDILKKIMLALGSSYLTLLVEHLQSLLTRGFQVHVLSVTIHGVLDCLRGKFEPGDIDNCLGNLLEVALNDIFGDVAAEKEVQKIASQIPEAKPSAKSFLVLHIAARNIQEACLLDLLMPFKDHLARSHSRKLILKIQDCFAKIVSGLVENPYISRESLLVFIYGTISESITDLLPGTQKRALTEKEKENIRRARPDCFIIQPTPKRRMGAVNKNVKSNTQANAHILVEFGLEMLHIVLKRKKLIELDYQAFLNPIFPLLKDSLKSTYIRVTTFTLKCLAALWNNDYEVPALDEYLSDIVTRMFEILKNLSSFGASKQEDNLQLIKSIMKAMVALLRQCPQYKLSAEEIDQLVLHIEQDLFEGDKQLISFSLLKAMIARKVDSPSVHNILKQIAEITVTSQSDYVRDESRNILLTYIMEYNLKKRVDQIVKNFTVQLCYTVPAGRLSAIQFMAAIIKRFPQSVLSSRAEFLYLSLGTRLVNDDDSTCRKEVAECIESLISRLEKSDRQRLFEITLLFFEEARKPSIREMAASLCSRFLNVEKSGFKARLPEVLPILVARLTLSNPRAAGKFVRAPTVIGVQIDPEHVKAKQNILKKKGKLQPNLEDQSSEEMVTESVLRKQRAIDHEIIQIQYCVHKILENCIDEVFSSNDEVLLSNIDELAYASQRLLAHEHVWVRCNAAKTIAQILAHFDFALVGRKLCRPQLELNGQAQWLNFIYSDPATDIRSLVLDLCAQMIPDETSQEMIDEVAKIFLFVANMLRNVPFTAQKEEDNKDEEETVKINLRWLLGRVRFLVNREVTKAPHCVTIRTALFNLIEGLITIVSVENLKELAPTLLLLLVREMSEDDQQIDLDLRQLALHVGSRLRRAIGTDTYDKLRAQAQTALLIRRAERKKIVAQEKIHDPVRAAKRKLSMQERKKAAKKRKNDVMRGRVEDTKQKLKKRKRKAEAIDLF